MSGVTSQSDPDSRFARGACPAAPVSANSLSAVRGRAEIGFVRKDGATRLAHLYQSDPLRVLFPNTIALEVPLAVVVVTSGGIVGGDSLEVAGEVGVGAKAAFMAQAAEKVYRSAGSVSTVSVRLTAGADAWLEWLPQETILFDGAKLRRETAVDIDPSAQAMVGEMLVFGRIARGERFSRGLARDAWEVRIGGRLAWVDALHLEGDVAATLADPACFDGATAAATFVHVGRDAPDRLELARSLLPAGDDFRLRAGATVVGGLLLARWLARDALALRTAYGAFWAAFRAKVSGLPAEVPKLWIV